jgi:hypothetical protein
MNILNQFASRAKRTAETLPGKARIPATSICAGAKRIASGKRSLLIKYANNDPSICLKS